MDESAEREERAEPGRGLEEVEPVAEIEDGTPRDEAGRRARVGEARGTVEDEELC